MYFMAGSFGELFIQLAFEGLPALPAVRQ